MPMSNAAVTLKQKAHELSDQLPDTATWDDLIEEACFRKAVEGGIAQADRGDFASEEDVRSAFARWVVKS